jgi:HK97 family phage major capsid protein
MFPLDHARTRLEEARAAHAALLADFESRINALSDIAATADVDRIHDDFAPKLDEAEALVKRCQTQLDTTERLARARDANQIPIGGDSTGEYRGGSFHVSEPATYDPYNKYSPSYFADLFRARTVGDSASIARLQRSTRESIADAERRGHPFRDAEGRALNSSSTTGGDFLPPIFAAQEWALKRRARRVTSLLVRNLPLSATGNSITIPKYSGPTDAVLVQTADNATVNSADGSTSTITLPVCTAVGSADTSRQIFERSEPGLDLVLLGDLYSDLNKKLNFYVVQGTGSNGQPQGILGTSSINSIVFTAATPTVALLYPRLLDAVRQVEEAVFDAPTAIVMTARRWAWIMAAVDTAGRPLAVPANQGVMNAAGLVNQNAKDTPFGMDAVTPAGYMASLPVYVDETLPKTLGASTSEDRIVVAQFEESLLFLDPNGPRDFVWDAPLSATAGIRLQVLTYFAFSAGRQPGAVSVISGSGLIAPTFT